VCKPKGIDWSFLQAAIHPHACVLLTTEMCSLASSAFGFAHPFRTSSPMEIDWDASLHLVRSFRRHASTLSEKCQKLRALTTALASSTQHIARMRADSCSHASQSWAST